MTTRMGTLAAKDLLLAERLDWDQTASILAPFGFRDIRAADRNLQLMADDPWARQVLSEIVDELLGCVSQSADPDQALVYLERFCQAHGNKVHLFSTLKQSPSTLELIAKTCGASPFMSEILIRNTHYLYWVADPAVLSQRRERRDLERDLAQWLKPLKEEQHKLDTLRTFKRREILHIGVRDLLRLATVQETVACLSTLAEVLISAAYKVCEAAMRRELPVSPRGSASSFAVLGLGKLGGGELNFSSDVDLIYVYDLPRRAATPGAEYFERLARRITAALSEVTNEGYVFRVDLRLRPEGRAGNVAHSLAELRRYYTTRAETWERLALVKAWPVAGNRSLGREFLGMVRPFVYGRRLDVDGLSQVKRIKRQIDQKMALRGQAYRNVKLGVGGIREIELIVQSLQVAFGRRLPEIRQRNTLQALRSLARCRLLSADEHKVLSEAYVFLRDVENKLQMFLDFQTHSIPAGADEARACAIRLGYRDDAEAKAADLFLKDYAYWTGEVNRVFRDFFDAPAASRLLASTRGKLKRPSEQA